MRRRRRRRRRRRSNRRVLSHWRALNHWRRRQRRLNNWRLDRPLHDGFVADFGRHFERGFHARRIGRRVYRVIDRCAVHNFKRRPMRIRRQSRFCRIRSRHIDNRLLRLERRRCVRRTRQLRVFRTGAAREAHARDIGPTCGVFRDAAKGFLDAGRRRDFLRRRHRTRVAGRQTARCRCRRDIVRTRCRRESLPGRRRAIDRKSVV